MTINGIMGIVILILGIVCLGVAILFIIVDGRKK